MESKAGSVPKHHANRPHQKEVTSGGIFPYQTLFSYMKQPSSPFTVYIEPMITGIYGALDLVIIKNFLVSRSIADAL